MLVSETNTQRTCWPPAVWTHGRTQPYQELLLERCPSSDSQPLAYEFTTVFLQQCLTRILNQLNPAIKVKNILHSVNKGDRSSWSTTDNAWLIALNSNKGTELYTFSKPLHTFPFRQQLHQVNKRDSNCLDFTKQTTNVYQACASTHLNM